MVGYTMVNEPWLDYMVEPLYDYHGTTIVNFPRYHHGCTMVIVTMVGINHGTLILVKWRGHRKT